jgi:hypothetical protein
MDFEQAVQLIDNIVSQVSLTRQQHVQAQQAVQAIVVRHNEQQQRITELEQDQAKAVDMPVYRKDDD